MWLRIIISHSNKYIYVVKYQQTEELKRKVSSTMFVVRDLTNYTHTHAGST